MSTPAEPIAATLASPVYAILPAHGGSGIDLVVSGLCHELARGCKLSVLLAGFRARGFPLWGDSDAPQRLDGRTWGAFVTQGPAFDTLEARDANPRVIGRLLDHAREKYQVICADLSDAKEGAAVEVIRHADAVFLVAGTDELSLQTAGQRASWLRSLDLDDRVGLLLTRARGGVTGVEAEDITGVPVCAVLDSSREFQRFAAWLAPTEILLHRSAGA